MRRWILICCPLIVMFVLSGFGFKPFKVEVPELLKVKEPTLVSFPQDDSFLSNYQIAPPFLGSQYIGFKEALAFKESQGRYGVINKYGYMGKYQFGKSTLELIGVYNTNSFLSNTKLQEAAFNANTSRNKWVLRKDIKRYVGRTIGGVKVTESGILAAAHLAGPGNVKKYLRSGGMNGFQDAFGTSIRHYLKKFSGYDTSFIEANKKAKV